MASSSKILGLLRTTLITLFPSIVSAPPHARLVFSQTFLADEQTRQDGGCAGHSSALCGESMKTSSRSEEHTSELQSLMRISYAVFCLKKKTQNTNNKENRRKHKQTHEQTT